MDCVRTIHASFNWSVPMNIQGFARDSSASTLLPLATQRLKFALRRLSWWVQHVELRLEDENGPRQGQDKRCRLLLRTRQGHALVLTDVADDWRVAFERALARLVRSLSSLHQRLNAVPRLRRGELLALPGPSASSDPL